MRRHRQLFSRCSYNSLTSRSSRGGLDGLEDRSPSLRDRFLSRPHRRVHRERASSLLAASVPSQAGVGNLQSIAEDSLQDLMERLHCQESVFRYVFEKFVGRPS